MSLAREPSARSLALVRWIDRRRWPIVLGAIVFALLGGWAASRLRLDQELRRLLPDHFPSVAQLDRASERLGNQNDLYVTIRSPSREASIAFGERLETELRERDDLRWVTFRRDRTFFADNALLFADLEDLLELRRELIGRIRDEVARQAYGDFAASKADPAQAPLGERRTELEQRYLARRDFAELDEADEGRIMVVRARPVAMPTDIATATRLQDEIATTIAQLDPATFHPEMVANLDGAYAQHSKRVSTLRSEVLGGNLAALAVLIVAFLASVAFYVLRDEGSDEASPAPTTATAPPVTTTSTTAAPTDDTEPPVTAPTAPTTAPDVTDGGGSATVESYCEAAEALGALLQEVIDDPFSADAAEITALAAELSEQAAEAAASASPEELERFNECTEALNVTP